MWPFVPASKIDWGATGAMVAAFAAILALVVSELRFRRQQSGFLNARRAEKLRTLAESIFSEYSKLSALIGTPVVNTHPKDKWVLENQRELMIKESAFRLVGLLSQDERTSELAVRLEALSNSDSSRIQTWQSNKLLIVEFTQTLRLDASKLEDGAS
ncbi:MAG: hypothetical protein AAGL99_04875 [Pseudomonadota bacterium]